MTVFDDLANAVSILIGSTPETAGWILGITFMVLVLVALAWLIGDEMGTWGLVIGIGVFVFIVGVGWWPLWTIIFIGLLIAFLIAKPLASGGSSSE